MKINGMLSQYFSFLKNSIIHIYTFYKLHLTFNILYKELLILIDVLYNYTCMEWN